MNAADAMSEKPHRAQADRGCAASCDDRARSAWRSACSDTGPGISPSILPRIFEPHFTTKAERPRLRSLDVVPHHRQSRRQDHGREPAGRGRALHHHAAARRDPGAGAESRIVARATGHSRRRAARRDGDGGARRLRRPARCCWTTATTCEATVPGTLMGRAQGARQRRGGRRPRDDRARGRRARRSSQVAPRRNAFSRRASGDRAGGAGGGREPRPGGAGRLDRDPEFRPGFADRVLCQAEHAGLPARLVLNKVRPRRRARDRRACSTTTRAPAYTGYRVSALDRRGTGCAARSLPRAAQPVRRPLGRGQEHAAQRAGAGARSARGRGERQDRQGRHTTTAAGCCAARARLRADRHAGRAHLRAVGHRAATIWSAATPSSAVPRRTAASATAVTPASPAARSARPSRRAAVAGAPLRVVSASCASELEQRERSAGVDRGARPRSSCRSTRASRSLRVRRLRRELRPLGAAVPVCPACGQPLVARYDLARVARRDAARGPGALRHRPVALPRACCRSRADFAAGAARRGRHAAAAAAAARARELGVAELWLKDEAGNPTQSFKARGLALAVNGALAFGQHGDRAAVGRQRRQRRRRLRRRRRDRAAASRSRRTRPRRSCSSSARFGAEVRLVPGTIADAGRALAAWAPAPEWWNVATFKEPFRLEGKKTLGYEIAEQCGLAAARRRSSIRPAAAPDWSACGARSSSCSELGWIERRRCRGWSRCRRRGCAPVVRAFERGADAHRAVGERARRWRAGCACRRRSRTTLILRAMRESRRHGGRGERGGACWTA